jgi:hypothetical protein
MMYFQHHITPKIWGVIILTSLSLGTHATEPEPRLETQIQKTASETFKSILGDAKQKGLVKPKSTEPVSLKQPSPNIENTFSNMGSETTSIKCSDLDVLDLSDLDRVESYTYLDVVRADDSDPELTRARRYLALGLGSEARNVVSNRADTSSKILKRAGAALDGIPGANLSEYAHCGIAGELWSNLGNSSFKTPERSDADLRIITDHIRAMPPHMIEIIGVQYGITAVRSKQHRNARAVWRMLQDTASLAGRPAPESRTGDHNILFLRAMLNEKMNKDIARNIYQYLSARDSVYAFPSVQRLLALSELERQNESGGNQASTTNEVDLKSLAHLYSGQTRGREANLFLIDLEVRSGNLTDAIRLTRDSFVVEDIEFSRAANSMGSVILANLKNPSLSEKLAALNVYLADRPFFEFSGLASELVSDAGSAAIQMGYPELAQIIYASNEYQHAERIIDAKARQDLKNGEFPSNDKFKDQDLIIFAIDKALASGDTKTARRFLTEIEDPEQFKYYRTLVSWIDRAWTSLSEDENSTPLIDLLSSRQIAAVSAKDLNLEALNFITLKTESDLAVGMEYLRNG